MIPALNGTTAPSIPTQNGYNGQMLDERLRETILMSLDHIRQKVAISPENNTWGGSFSPRYLAPAAFPAKLNRRPFCAATMLG